MEKPSGRIWLVGVLLAGVVLTACQPGAPTPTATSSAPKPTATSAEATTPIPAPTEANQTQAPISKDVRLDPAIAQDTDSVTVNGYLYEGLVKMEGGSPAPALAISWIISEDGLDYIFSLRPGVVFHDDSPLNADAVTANFNRWFDPEDPLHGTGIYSDWQEFFLGFKGETEEDGSPKSSFDGIEKANDLTVLIHLNRQDEALLTNLAQTAFSIVNPTTLAAEGDKYGTAAGSGTGPYSVSERTDTQLVLAPNSKYWGTVPAGSLEFPYK